jgi:hypothetical protein
MAGGMNRWRSSMASRPAPAFSVGQRVRVILNEQNRTARVGTIRGIMWHFKDGRYNYYLEEGGKKVSKRYFQEDLEAVPQKDEQAKPVPQALEGQMTEAEWLGCDDPETMLEFVQGKVSERKLQLFAVACCRRISHLLKDKRSQDVIEVLEQFAEGEVREGALSEAEEAAGDVWHTAAFSESGFSHAETDASHAVWEAVRFPQDAVEAASRSSALAATGWSKTHFTQEYTMEQTRPYIPQERHVQAALLRDLLGPLPFRDVRVPVSVLSWNDGCVVKLATAIYEEREFTPKRMGVLADALEDAGLKDEEVVRHCRQEGAHVRGCWVVDLLLGKS